jgi:ubiquitin-protein ligase
MPNIGAQFVINYLNRHWANERNQDRWTIMINEININKLFVLYNFSDETAVFKDLQLIFEIAIHEEHPYKAPSIKVLTPNGRTMTNESICIDGLTVWHPESWCVVTTMSSIIERFLSAFIDIENVEKGVGFIKDLNYESIRRFANESHVWNLTNYEQVVSLFQEQCYEFHVSESLSKIRISANEEKEEIYEYSDEEIA